MSSATDVTVYHLEMRSRDELIPATSRVTDVILGLVEIERAATARDCYHAVGRDWSWSGRLDWSLGEWEALLEEEQGELWVAKSRGELVGYAQLARQQSAVEIHYFGLTPEFIGRGIGGWMLTRIVERCWAMGAERVILNTCTLDGPGALPNYRARGFRVIREVLKTQGGE